MSAVAAGRILQQLVRNPRARKFARRGGMAMVRGIGRSRVRRANRGRWYMGRKMGIPPSLSYRRRPARVANFAATSGAAAVSAVPAAYNAASTMVSGRMRMMKCEKGDLVVDCETGDNGGLHVYMITPTDARLWPVLAQTADTYTKYRFLKLQCEYRPRTGTTANGTLYMGWQPQATDSTANFPTVEVIASMPKACTSSIRNGAVLSIPTDQAGPTEKYMRAISGQNYDPLNYYNGTLVVTAQGDDNPSVGEIWLNYVIELIQPKVDMVAKTSAYNFLTDTAERGNVNCRATGEAGHCFVSSPMQITCLIHVTFASGTPVIQLHKNDVDIGNTHFFYNATHAFALVRLGACPRDNDIDIEITGVTPTAKYALFTHTIANW